MAASVHNSQPWRFVVTGSRVELWLDPRVRPTVIDPDGRLALASLGAAAANLELGLRCRLQRAVRLDVLPGTSPERAVRGLAAPGHEPARALLVLATAGDSHQSASARERDLHAAIPLRRTTRQPLYGRVDADTWALSRDVVRSTTQDASQVDSLRPDAAQTAALLDIMADVDLRWRRDAAYLAEIERWSHECDGRGVPSSAYGPRDVSGRMIGRDFSIGVASDHWRPADDYFEISPQLLVITTVTDDARAWVRSGYAMERAMLTATARGLGVGVLGQLVDDPGARHRTGDALGLHGRTVQHVLRLGQPGTESLPGRMPRRPLSEVIAG
jgi:nitroreductase